MTDGIPLDLADRLLAARWDHTAAVTRDAARSLAADARAAGMCGARCTRSGGLSALEHRICIEPTLHLGYHWDAAATFWPQDAAELEATGRRLVADRDGAIERADRLAEELERAERGLDRWCEWQDQVLDVGGAELLDRLTGLGPAAPPCRHEREIAELRRALERVRDQGEATPEEWGEARNILGGTHATDARVFAALALARTNPARADR